MLPWLNKTLNSWLQVADCCQKYSDYERHEVPTQFSTPVLDIMEVINLLGFLAAKPQNTEQKVWYDKIERDSWHALMFISGTAVL